MYAEVQRWQREQVAFLLGRMEAAREPDGSSLPDNSLIVYGSTLGDGNEHDKTALPPLILGRDGGLLKAGRAIEYATPMNFANIHLGLLQRTGRPLGKFASSGGAAEELAG